jgi:hypothetical protein
MMDAELLRDQMYAQMLLDERRFDWLTVLALFLVGLFFLLPQLRGQSLSGRGRGCFTAALWILVVKLFFALVRIILLNLDLFNQVVGPRRTGSGPSLTAIVGLFFPILEGMLFLLAVVMFVAGVPGMILRREPWEAPPREEPRG